MQSKKFRTDINGLRAIAVLSVMFFHFNQELVPGGFAGVDVFFVISGFLMTSIIFRGLENNNFSLWDFLKARTRRIVPALVTVISIVLALGYLFFEPITYQLAGKHGFSSLLFVSNITYANEAGYFDADSFSKLFLHTWSLSVEWQFYIIYPIVLLILSKLFSINTLKKFIVIFAIMSFAFCVYFSSINKTLSYFMIYTRGWEMLLGGIAFIFPLSTTKNKKRIIEALGLILIITSFFIFSDNDNWPSYNALLPVFGAYLCILSNNEKTLLSNIIFQKIGLWSYSIYLIHWPFIVFFKKVNIDISILIYLTSTILLAFIVYSLIEKRRNYKYGLLLCWILSICASYYISVDGISKRVDKKYQLSASEYHEKYYGGSGFLHEGTPEKIGKNEPEFIIFGDSYARQYLRYFKENDASFISIMKDGCYYLGSFINHSSEWGDMACKKRFNSLMQVMNEYPNLPIVIAHSWSDYENKLVNIDTNKKLDNKDYANVLINDLVLISKNKRVFLIGSNFTTNKNNTFECLSRNNMLPKFMLPYLTDCDKAETTIPHNINNLLIEISKNNSNVKFIDPNKSLCNLQDKCNVLYDGEPVLSDGSHLSYFGTKVAGKYILSNIK